MPSLDQEIYIPELGRRISTINQLTRQQHASLLEDQLLRVLSFMANYPSAMGLDLMHQGGWRQPVNDESSSSDQGRTDQDTSSEVGNAPAGPSRLVQLASGGRRKAQAQHGHARGRRAREEEEDLIQRGEDTARPLLQFEVDRDPSKITERELDMIKQLYYVPDYVEFWLLGPSNQPTRPPLSYIAIYRDYFIKRLRLPLHPFIREVLLNLDVSLP